MKNNSKTSEQLSTFLAFVRALTSEYDYQHDEVNKYDKETQDILHQFEFGSRKERAKFATQLSRIRKQRRISKDFVDVNSELVQYLKSHEFVAMQRKLEQYLGNCRKQERYVEQQRSYRSRVRDDLTIRTVTEDNSNE